MNDLNALNKLDSKCTWNTGPIEMKTVVIEPRDNTVCDHTIFYWTKKCSYLCSIIVNVFFPIGPIPIEILNTNTCIPGMALNFQIFVVTSIYGRFLLFCIFVIRYVTDYLEKCRDADFHWGRSEDEPSLDFLKLEKYT